MSRLLIYFFPMIMNVILSTLFFVCSIRLAENGASALAVSMVCTLWAITYSLSALLAGRIATVANSTRLLIGSCLAMVALSLLFIIFGGLQTQYVFMIISGMLTAMFFTPFQVFMKAVFGGNSGNLSVSIGLYTISWSVGLACGFFISGLLWELLNSWRICHAVNAIMALCCAGGIYMLRHHARPRIDGVASVVPAAQSYHGQYDFAMIGWICSGISFLIIAMLRAVFPTQATSLQIPKADQGIVFALLYLTQGFVGLGLSLFKFWMYRTLPIIIMTVLGTIGLLCFGLSIHIHTFYLAAVMIGIYGGAAAFYIAFHALVHPEKSTRNVSINEAVVGLTGIIGPLIGGIIGDRISLSAPFIFCAIITIIAIIIQFRTHRRHPLKS